MAKGIRVVSGAERITSEGIIGSTVAQVRADFADLINIPADAVATVNSNTPATGYKLQAGDELVFTRPLGQKGFSC